MSLDVRCCDLPSAVWCPPEARLSADTWPTISPSYRITIIPSGLVWLPAHFHASSPPDVHQPRRTYPHDLTSGAPLLNANVNLPTTTLFHIISISIVVRCCHGCSTYVCLLPLGRRWSFLRSLMSISLFFSFLTFYLSIARLFCSFVHSFVTLEHFPFYYYSE